jgi:hypothetical protein
MTRAGQILERDGPRPDDWGNSVKKIARRLRLLPAVAAVDVCPFHLSVIRGQLRYQEVRQWLSS